MLTFCRGSPTAVRARTGPSVLTFGSPAARRPDARIRQYQCVEFDPHALGQIVDDIGADWMAQGISIQYHPSSEDGRNKFACYVQADTKDALGQLTVWNSGEVDIDGGYVSDGDTFSGHREIRSVDQLRECVEELRRRLLARS